MCGLNNGHDRRRMYRFHFHIIVPFYDELHDKI
jgi:hypothetical protein